MKKFLLAFLLFVFLVPPLSAAAQDSPVKTITVQSASGSGNLKSKIKNLKSSKPFTVGTHIAVLTNFSDWENISEPTWRLALRSEGAAFIRPHFVADEYSAFVVYGENGMLIPVAGAGEFWGPVIEGDMLFVEAASTTGEPPALEIDSVSHGAIAFWRFKEDTCYLDVNCFADWASLKSAIAYLLIEKSTESVICTGSLIADTHATRRPWLLTAHHCMLDESEAQSLLAYWDFETSSCNGPAPTNVEAFPHTTGADYMTGGEDSDFSLVLLREDPPAGTAFLDWSSDDVAAGEPIAVIHHPGGTYKRISFGRVSDISDDRYWTVLYNPSEGSTEPGSSGAPLFDSQKRLIGQLSGGDAACYLWTLPDYYGRFGVSWNDGLENFLTKTCIPTTTSTTTTIPDNQGDDTAPSSRNPRPADSCGC